MKYDSSTDNAALAARNGIHVLAPGGHITQPVFAFPGGRRFHFTDPHGYALAVWSKD